MAHFDTYTVSAECGAAADSCSSQTHKPSNGVFSFLLLLFLNFPYSLARILLYIYDFIIFYCFAQAREKTGGLNGKNRLDRPWQHGESHEPEFGQGGP
jgi:hypothetical protein